MREFITEQGVFEAGPNDELGKGTYGTVYRVRLKGNPSVKRAIKTFCPDTIDENEGVPSTTLREVNAVKSVNHPNVMSIEEVVIPTSGPLTEMFVVMELCKGTLKEKVQDMITRFLRGDPKWVKPTSVGGNPPRLPPDYVREAKLVAWQILNAVAVCHSRGIMHRDLKPANILWSEGDLLKIADFGLARFVRGRPISEDHVVPQTGEVQTMWYRAPEVLLGDEKYGMLVDDWSIGCVIAELFRFRMSVSNQRVEPDPLFAGRGDVHTMLLVFEALGTPDEREEYLSTLPFWSDYFPKWNPGTLRQKVQLVDDNGFDLIKQLLAISPTRRKASRFLLNHPWFQDVRETINARYVPWYRGYEPEILRVLEIGRMPPAQPLPLVNKADTQAQQREAMNAQSRATTTTGSGPILASNTTTSTTWGGSDFPSSTTGGPTSHTQISQPSQTGVVQPGAQGASRTAAASHHTQPHHQQQQTLLQVHETATAMGGQKARKLGLAGAHASRQANAATAAKHPEDQENIVSPREPAPTTFHTA